MTLVEFLLARIAEDAALAEQADWAMQGTWYTEADDAVDKYVQGQSPRRVLAECDAKRKIVALHAAHPEPQRMVYGTILACSTCGSVDDSPVEWPCETVRALASIYAAHPDFNPEWLL